MAVSPTISGSMEEFALQIESILDAPNFLSQLGQLLKGSGPLLGLLTEEQLQGSPSSYTRNQLYADPAGRFTVMALAWQRGQFTPIHGHWTWCGYSVLRGIIEEETFDWDSNKKVARLTDHAPRKAGYSVASPAGLDDIHRLANYGAETAISLHIYGVGPEAITSRVNRIVAGAHPPLG